MAIKEKVFNYVQTEHKKKLPVEDKIEYLKTIKEEKNLDLNDSNSNYITNDGVIVKNVVNNIKKYYKRDKLSIVQMMRCEDIGIIFNEKLLETDDEIQYLKKAKDEKIKISEISTNAEKYNNNSIYKYIDDLRKKYNENLLNEKQIDTCIHTLKIIIPDEDKKEILIKKIRESAFKNIMTSENFNEIVS